MPNPNNHDVKNAQSLKRSTYDMSRSNMLTANIGDLVPVWLEECVVGDTWKVSPNFNIQFPATKLPLMNKMKCVIDYFFVPFMAVWEDQNAFFTQGMNNTVPPPAHPFLQITPLRAKKMLGVSTLSDYLGVNTFVHKQQNVTISYPLYNQFEQNEEREMDMIYSNSCITYAGEDAPSTAKELIANRLEQADKLTSADFIRSGVDMCFDENSCTRTCMVGSWIAPPALQRKTLLHGSTIATDRQAFNGTILEDYQFKLSEKLASKVITFTGGVTSPIPTSNDQVYIVIARADNTFSPQRVGKVPADILGICDNSYVPSAVGFSVSGTGNSDYQITLSDDDLEMINQYIENVNVGSSGRSSVILGFFSFYEAGAEFSSNSVYGWFSPTFGLYSFRQQVLSNGVLSRSSRTALIYSGEKLLYAAPVTYGSDTFVSGAGTLSVQAVNASPFQVSDVLVNSHPNYLGICVGLTYSVTVRTQELANSPYVGSNPAYPLDAIPFRAYECVYNFFYRNKDIDYLREDAEGKPTDNFEGATRVVDRFLTRSQRASGADTFDYMLHNALLEKDMFTSCLTEPLINYHPLIGIRQKANSSNFDFAVDNGVVTITAEHVSTGGFDLENAKVSSYGTSLQDTEISALKDVIATGITLADIRSAENLQAWISHKVQHGYNFNEQQLAQFGIHSRWNPLTAPEYLGSAAQMVNNGMIVSSDADSMGSTAGLPIARSESENNIVCHCSERGYMIGILRVVPTPVYESAMRAQMRVKDYTEYWHPEFDNKGWEEVKYHEIAPVMAHAAGKLDDTFGYNVPWHRYKSTYNEIHGDASINFRNSVMKRDFEVLPTLSRSFIECRHDQYDNVFQYSSLGMQYIAEIYHTARAERPMIDYQSRV